jgi:hypothetical protein
MGTKLPMRGLGEYNADEVVIWQKHWDLSLFDAKTTRVRCGQKVFFEPSNPSLSA